MNCLKFEIARKTVLYYLFNKKSFSLEQLFKEIERGGGVFMISSSQSVYKYLSLLEEQGLIVYIPKEKIYLVLVNTKSPNNIRRFFHYNILY